MNGARPGSGSTSESFADLVSFGGANTKRLQKMSLLDRRKAVEDDKRRKKAEEHNQVTGAYGMNTSAWDALESLKSPIGHSNSNGISQDSRVDSVGSHLSEFEASAPVNHKSRYPTTEFLEDDDPFDLKSLPKIANAPLTNDNDNGDDDFLGELGKPLSANVRDKMDPRFSEAIDPQNARGASSSIKVSAPRRDDPRDSAIACMVDMGFTDSDARRALANTDTGLDVHAAITNVLSKAHQNQRLSPSPALGIPPDNRREEDSGRSTPTTDIGQSFLKNANMLWSQGRKKVARAIEDFGREEDPTLPKWMRPDQSNQTLNPNRTEITEEAKALEMNHKQIRRPVTAGSTRPIRRGDVTDEVYTSPARRRQDTRLFETSSQVSRPSSVPNQLSTTRSTPPLQSPVTQNIDSRAQSPLLSMKPNAPIAKKEPIPIQPSFNFSQETLSPKAIDQLNTQREIGSAAFTRGDYSAAVHAYTIAIAQLPGNHVQSVVLWCNRALCLMKIGDPKAAIADCDAVLHLVGLNHSHSVQVNGQSKKLREYWAKAITRRAECLEQLERYADAYDAWDRAAVVGVGGLIAVEGKRRMENLITNTPFKRPVSTPARKVAKSTNGSRKTGEAVRQLRVAEQKAQEEDDQRFAFHENVATRTSTWKGGKENNLRALLGSLETILWPEVGWEKTKLVDLVQAKRVKVVYMRAIAKVHPDKLSADASVEQRMIASSVFTALNEAWEAFKKEL